MHKGLLCIAMKLSVVFLAPFCGLTVTRAQFNPGNTGEHAWSSFCWIIENPESLMRPSSAYSLAVQDTLQIRQASWQ